MKLELINKLLFKNAIASAGYNIQGLAQLMGVNQATLYRKINGKSEFDRPQLKQLREVLGLDDNQFEAIFFAL